MPAPFMLTSKSPLYGPGLIVENGQKRPLSEQAAKTHRGEELSDKSRDLVAQKAAEEEKKAK